jgi:uncharacterized protein YndB with AHSA1/START domain
MTEPRIIGSLREESGKGVVHVEDVYPTDIDDLWSAITEPARLARWIGTVEGDLRVGGAFTARFTSTWEGTGTVDVCEAPHRLVVTTQDEDEIPTVIEALLTAEGDGTRLVIEDRGLPLEHYADHGSGWQAHIEDLAALIDGREPANWHARWVELTPSYREMLSSSPRI